jgi:hypothetical protein
MESVAENQRIKPFPEFTFACRVEVLLRIASVTTTS